MSIYDSEVRRRIDKLPPHISDTELLAKACRVRNCINYAEDNQIYCVEHTTQCGRAMPPDLAARKKALNAATLKRILKNCK
jgi:hypothetical protein